LEISFNDPAYSLSLSLSLSLSQIYSGFRIAVSSKKTKKEKKGKERDGKIKRNAK